MSSQFGGAVIGAVALVVLVALLPGHLGALPRRSAEHRQVATTTTATISTDALNVREAPSLDSAIFDTLPVGTQVSIIGEPLNGFLPVDFRNETAWMAAEYLATGDGPIAHDWNARVLAQGAATTGSRLQTGAPGQVGAIHPIAPVTQSATSDDQGQAVADESMAVDVLVPSDEPLELVIPAAMAGENSGSIAEGTNERWIEVERSSATVTLHDGSGIVATFHGKIGRDPSADGYYSTANGTFHVYSMSQELSPTPFAEDVYLTDWVGFDPMRSNGFHSPVRDRFGAEKPVQNSTTLGCVRLEDSAAEQVFAFAFIRMRVEIHD